MKPSMSHSPTLRNQFLRQWLKGLHVYTNLTKSKMGILHRKTAIKLSADAAMASAREASTQWNRALMDDVISSSRGPHRILVEHILGHKVSQIDDNNNNNSNNKKKKELAMKCSKRILRKSRGISGGRRVVPRSSEIGRKIVRKKTRVLKRLVPGGERMGERCLIRETLDYISSLRVQVDVMRLLAAGGGGGGGGGGGIIAG